MRRILLMDDLMKKNETKEEQQTFKNHLLESLEFEEDLPDCTEEMFSREFLVESNKNLLRLMDNYPSNILLIGAGGIGSWIAFYLAKMKPICNLILVDPDIVETSNLGRTPFTLQDVGCPKVESCARMVVESSPHVHVFPLKVYFNENVINAVNNIFLLPKEKLGNQKRLTVIDCRDNEFRDYEILEGIKLPKKDIELFRVAYDGEYITMDYNPGTTVSGGAGGYETQPSQVIPSSLAGICALLMILQRYEHKGTEINSYPVTFNVTRLIDYIFLSKQLLQFSNSDPKISELIKSFYFKKGVVKKVVDENIIFSDIYG